MPRDVDSLVDILQAARRAVDLVVVWDTIQKDVSRLVDILEPLI
ncbi:MAG: hypothetical protein ACYC64_17255 [Armatimonadota bacterium]